MKLAGYELKLEKRVSLSAWQAAAISILAILTALMLFALIFIQAGINPIHAYREIFSYAFFNPFGIPLTISRFIFLLLCTFAFIIPFTAGLWNIGMTGQLYAGTLAAYAVLMAFGGDQYSADQRSPLLVLPIMLIAAGIGGSLIGAIAGFLKGRFNVNEIVVTMMLNFIMFWLVSFMIKEGGPFMNPGGRGESFEIPTSLHPPLLFGIPFTILIALGVAVLLYFWLNRTRIGYQIRAYGMNPSAAEYAGISKTMIPLLVFVLGGFLAGISGYHYFVVVPGVYKIARNYGYFGDLAFYGIICGLISQGNPIAAIPVALLFGGLSIGGRFVQGKLGMAFGVDYALLGVLMITLVGFQFFYRYRIVIAKTTEESIDVGIPG
jgi:simple sugar transport system permease protein